MIKQEVLLQRSLQRGTVDLLYVEHRPQGVAFAQPATFLMVAESALDAHIVEPVLRLDGDAAQSLMDQLWNIGTRPSDLNRQPALANTWLQDQLVKFIDQATTGATP